MSSKPAEGQRHGQAGPDHGDYITQSTGVVGWDKAVTEDFFSHLKTWVCHRERGGSMPWLRCRRWISLPYRQFHESTNPQ